MTHLLIVSKVNGTKYVYDYYSASLKCIEAEMDNYLSTVPDDLESFCRIQIIESPSKTHCELRQEDSYFQDAKFVSSLEQLYFETKKMLNLNSLDMASYILSKYPKIGSFAMQKALYYLYAEYLCKYNKALFDAEFVAFDSGPVEFQVYKVFTYEEEKLRQNNFWELKLFQHKEDISYIDEVLSKSVEYFVKIYRSQWQEVDHNYTHRAGTPWSLARMKGRNSIISNELILEYHCLEI